MANQDEMMAKIKCNKINEDFLEFFNECFNMKTILLQKGFSEQFINEVEQADNHFLGNVGLLFVDTNNEKSFIASFNEAWRSFVDGIIYQNNELTIYFRSGDGGSRRYFKSLHENFKKNIEKISITLSDDLYGEELEFLQDEYGDDFLIEIE